MHFTTAMTVLEVDTCLQDNNYRSRVWAAFSLVQYGRITVYDQQDALVRSARASAVAVIKSGSGEHTVAHMTGVYSTSALQSTPAA